MLMEISMMVNGGMGRKRAEVYIIIWMALNMMECGKKIKEMD
jgi:hypothetical protein